MFFLTFLLGACSFSMLRQAPDAQKYYPFRPPTISPSSTPTVPIPTATPVVVANGPDCSNDLRFVTDLTIPDGTTVVSGSSLDKRWKVENNGTCDWDGRYRVRLMTGSAMGAESEQYLFPAKSGTNITIRITFTAPKENGGHRSMWQAVDPSGLPFGDPFFIEINVITAPSP